MTPRRSTTAAANVGSLIAEAAAARTACTSPADSGTMAACVPTRTVAPANRQTTALRIKRTVRKALTRIIRWDPWVRWRILAHGFHGVFDRFALRPFRRNGLETSVETRCDY